MKPAYVALDRSSALLALERLAHSLEDRAPVVYVHILEALGESPNGGRSCRLPVVNGEPEILRRHHIRTGLLECVRRPRWVGVYKHPVIEGLTVTVRTPDRPARRRMFTGPVGSGRRNYVLVSRAKLKSEEDTVATKTKTRSRRSKAPETVEVDDLEELEALEELEDDEDEDETPPKRTRKRRSRKAAEPEPDEDEDEEDDEDEDDEDEEEDEPAPRARKRRAKAATKKSTSKKRGNASNLVRELPKGKVGVEDVAKLAGTDGRTVRQYLRKEGVEKTDGRYAFTPAQAKKMAAAIKKARK